ncbi:3-phosphoserine/phosphohydroxythreonine transaminase [Wandonia haliotis]|uniref:Phosphoserine aminotransferase n=1 Tax=Wandonia haliotis TaxID=574963 RepID=A0ABN1MPT2_9FLAO
MSKKHNFGAGPCILPQEVFQEASQAVLDFNGLSILEVSHRSKDFVAVMEEAQNLVKKALNVPDGYSVIFLQGGASLGFLITAMNMARENKKAAYINTGQWASKAIEQAEMAGLEVEVIASSEEDGFTYIPKDFVVPEDVDYVHITSNNTIFGTQFKSFPKTGKPLVCDMSSDIFSREFNVADFDLIYAGAQKNLGPAGATLYIVKDEVLGKSSLGVLPTYLDLSVHQKKESMFNTPPVFSVYVSMLNLRHLINNGGVKAQEELNNKKAELLYNEIDNNPKFKASVNKEDRSNMNVVFFLADEAADKERFDQLWNDAGIVGLKGYRTLGGYRASMYNALPLESVQVLVDIMKKL